MDLTSAQFCERASIPLHAVGHIRRNIPNFPCVKGRGGRGPTGALLFWSMDADALASLMGLGFSLTESAKIIANFSAMNETINIGGAGIEEGVEPGYRVEPAGCAGSRGNGRWRGGHA